MRVYQFRHIRVPSRIEHSARLAGRGHDEQSRRAGTVVARVGSRRAGHPGALLASGASIAPLSSRGLGRRPLMAETRVRIPVAVLPKPPRTRGFSRFQGRRRNGYRNGAQSLCGEMRREKLPDVIL